MKIYDENGNRLYIVSLYGYEYNDIYFTREEVSDQVIIEYVQKIHQSIRDDANKSLSIWKRVCDKWGIDYNDLLDCNTLWLGGSSAEAKINKYKSIIKELSQEFIEECKKDNFNYRLQTIRSTRLTEGIIWKFNLIPLKENSDQNESCFDISARVFDDDTNIYLQLDYTPSDRRLDPYGIVLDYTQSFDEDISLDGEDYSDEEDYFTQNIKDIFTGI